MNSVKISPFEKRVRKTITIPGSKSYTNRAFLIASLSCQPTIIHNILLSDDTKAMVDCLKKLGMKITQKGKTATISGNIQDIHDKEYILDANLSGTTIRFLLALSTIIPGVQILHGEKELNKRPIKDLVDALRILGAKIEYLQEEGFPPIKVSSTRLIKNKTKISGAISSQFLSALLMIAPIAGITQISIQGKQISKPYVDMTLDIMKQFSVIVKNDTYKNYHIRPGQVYLRDKYIVEGDVSSASYFAAIAVLTNSTITLKNLNPNSVQADINFFKILEKMGNTISYRSNEITIKGDKIKPMNVDMENCPDQAQTMAVLAAFERGVTKISGIKSLRVKETERVIALQSELRKMGINTSSTNNSLLIYGGNPKATAIDTYGDHRMAMSFAVAGTKLSGIIINNPEVVNKTFPDFWEKLNGIGAKTDYFTSVNQKSHRKTNIVLIGMRGSGKSTIGKMLAKKLKKKYIEMDDIIIKKTNMNITDIVKKYGWDYFRKKESEITQEISDLSNTVISTGGGVIVKKENVILLKKNGMLILLDASIDTLLKRMSSDTSRPALTDKSTKKEELVELLKQRKKIYNHAADIIINTEIGTPQNITDEIANILNV